MRGAKARGIRRKIYINDLAPRYRQYSREYKTGAIQADPRRRLYQRLKRSPGLLANLMRLEAGVHGR